LEGERGGLSGVILAVNLISIFLQSMHLGLSRLSPDLHVSYWLFKWSGVGNIWMLIRKAAGHSIPAFRRIVRECYFLILWFSLRGHGWHAGISRLRVWDYPKSPLN
jgi:hypothetical protein